MNDTATNKKEIYTMLIKSGFNSKSYEFINTKKVIPVIITGQNDEDGIEPFKTLIHFELQGKEFLAMDARNLIRKSALGKSYIRDMVNSKEHYEFEKIRLVNAIDTIEAPTANKVVSKQVIQSMGALLSRLLSRAATLSLLEQYNVEIMVQYYYASLYVQEISDLSINQRLSVTLPKIALSLKDNALKTYGAPRTFSGLLTSLSKITPKLRNIDVNYVVTLLSRIAIVPNPSFNAYLLLTDVPSLMAYIDVATSQRINSRSLMNDACGKIQDIDRIHDYGLRLLDKYTI